MPQAAGRRELLSDAAVEVLAREGGRGLTHRAVDREARVPLGTAKNYFPNRDSLFTAVAARMTEQHTAAVAGLHEQAPQDVTPGDLAALYAAMLQRAATSGRSQFLALFELHLEAVRRPQLRTALGRMALDNVDSAAQLHALVGLQVDSRGAGLLDACFMGVAMSMLSLPDEALRAVGLDDPAEIGPALLAVAYAEPEPDPGGRGAVGGSECRCAR